MAGSIEAARRLVRFFPVFLILQGVITGCNGEPAQQEYPFQTRIDGLPVGTFDSATGCVSFEMLSVKIEDVDTGRQLTVYSGTGCRSDDRLAHRELPVDLHFAGIVGDKLVLDEGTDVNSRRIVIMQPGTSKRIQTLPYELEPRFAGGDLVYFQPTDTEAKKSQCMPEEKSRVSTWERFGMPVMLAKQMRYDFAENSVDSTGKTTCYALQ
jgi:hypothetical protein